MIAVRRAARSPYELTAGSALDDLHPVLRTYFGVIPPGHRGYGSGVFDVIGTPRAWLRPALGLLARQGIAFPVWEKEVPFTIENAPLVDREGRTAVVAERRFHFVSGTRSMIDAITAENPGADGLVDHLGIDRRFRVRLSVRVVRGELHLASTGFEVRIGRQHFALPRSVAPRLALVERFDDSAHAGEGAQRVTMVVDVPLLGRLYEYTGTFRYEIRLEESAATEVDADADADRNTEPAEDTKTAEDTERNPG